MNRAESILEWSSKRGLGGIYTRDPMPDEDSLLGVPDGQHPFDCTIRDWADRWCLNFQNVYVSFRRGYSILKHERRYVTQKNKSVVSIGEAKKGRIKHPLYSTWTGMIQRCYKASCKSFPKYGARGITVCERWKNSFEAFVEDMGSKPNGYTIDRINNTKGYSPENCRWANWITQANNRSNNIPEHKFPEAVEMYNKGGVSLRGISRELGMPYGSVWKAINDHKSDFQKSGCSLNFPGK